MHVPLSFLLRIFKAPVYDISIGQRVHAALMKENPLSCVLFI